MFWENVFAEFLGGLGTAVVLALFAYITRKHVFFKIVRKTAKHLREDAKQAEQEKKLGA